MASRRRDLAKERGWRDVVRRQAVSGLSVRAFCRREGVSEPSFHAWRRTIRKRDGRLAPLSVDLAESRRVADPRHAAEIQPAAGPRRDPGRRVAQAKSGSSPRATKPAAFVPAVIRGAGPLAGLNDESALVIELAGGRVLRLPEGISPARLVELIEALEARVNR